jgi:hypothetical protein
VVALGASCVLYVGHELSKCTAGADSLRALERDPAAKLVFPGSSETFRERHSCKGGFFPEPASISAFYGIDAPFEDVHAWYLASFEQLGWDGAFANGRRAAPGVAGGPEKELEWHRDGRYYRVKIYGTPLPDFFYPAGDQHGTRTPQQKALQLASAHSIVVFIDLTGRQSAEDPYTATASDS